MFRLALPLMFLSLACTSTGDTGDTKPTANGGDDGGGDGGDGGGGDGSSDGGDGGADGGGDGGTDGGSDGSTAWEPSEGHWTYTGAGSLLSDSCGYDSGSTPSGDAGGFQLSGSSPDGFSMVFDGSSDNLGCSLTDMSFSCSSFTGREPVPDTSGTIVSTTTHSGIFSDEGTVSSRFDIHIDCEGGDCDLIETFGEIDFPCDVAFQADAALDG